MRTWLIIALMVIMGVAFGISIQPYAGTAIREDINSGTSGTPTASFFNVHVECTPPVFCYYSLEGNVLVVKVTVQRANPCQVVFVHREVVNNRMNIIVDFFESNGVCAQVLPPPDTYVFAMDLNASNPDVYIKSSVVHHFAPKLPKSVKKEENVLGVNEIHVPTMPDLMEAKCREINALLVRARKEKNASEVKQLTKMYEHICGTFKETNEINVEKVVREVNRLTEHVREIAHAIKGVGEAVAIAAREVNRMIHIENGRVSIGDINIPVPDVNVIAGRLMVSVRKGVMEIEQNGVKVRANVQIDITPQGKVLANGRPVIGPNKVVERIRTLGGQIEHMVLKMVNNTPTYVAEVVKTGKLLGIFPVTVRERVDINAESGQIIKKEAPWWSFLIFW